MKHGKKKATRNLKVFLSLALSSAVISFHAPLQGGVNEAARQIFGEYKAALKTMHKSKVNNQDLIRHLRRLEALGPDAAPVLCGELENAEDWRVRLLAVRALRPLREPDAIPAFIKACCDRYYIGVTSALAKYEIREEAIAALTEFGEDAHGILLETAADKNHANQLCAILALQRLDVPGEARILIWLSKDTSLKRKNRKEVVKGLSGLGTEAHLALVELLAHKDVRKEAALALKTCKDREVLEPLMTYVRGAEMDYPLAKEAALVIRKIDRTYRPRDENDYLDLRLITAYPWHIKRDFGKRAVPRLTYWSKSTCWQMKRAANAALSHYKKK